MDCASAAYTNAATVLCSAESKLVAQNPEQRRVGFRDDLVGLAINMERILRHCEKACSVRRADGNEVSRLERGMLNWDGTLFPLVSSEVRM